MMLSLRSLRAAALLALLPLGACGLLDTEQPNIIDPGEIDSPEGAQALREGAIADFGFAKDGDGTQFDDGLILTGGLLADEFVHSTTPPSQQEVDQRTTALINPRFRASTVTCTRRAGGLRWPPPHSGSFWWLPMTRPI